VKPLIVAEVIRLLERQLSRFAFERRPRSTLGDLRRDVVSPGPATTRGNASRVSEGIFEASIAELGRLAAIEGHGSG
jgi:hypothetical protein